jgi:hypothetical protein
MAKMPLSIPSMEMEEYASNALTLLTFFGVRLIPWLLPLLISNPYVVCLIASIAHNNHSLRCGDQLVNWRCSSSSIFATLKLVAVLCPTITSRAADSISPSMMKL